jgi:hypothetical protein
VTAATRSLALLPVISDPHGTAHVLTCASTCPWPEPTDMGRCSSVGTRLLLRTKFAVQGVTCGKILPRTPSARGTGHTYGGRSE